MDICCLGDPLLNFFSIKHDMARSCFQFWPTIGDGDDKILSPSERCQPLQVSSTMGVPLMPRLHSNNRLLKQSSHKLFNFPSIESRGEPTILSDAINQLTQIITSVFFSGIFEYDKVSDNTAVLAETLPYGINENQQDILTILKRWGWLTLSKTWLFSNLNLLIICGAVYSAI